MATSSPISFLDGLFDQVSTRLQPPAWVVEEAQQRLVLLLNHVLQQEPEACARLARQKGRSALVQWRSYALQLIATPAGLLDRVAPGANAPAADLTLTVNEPSPSALLEAALRGDKPPVRIEGDVQFAAELNWLVDHVRWDVEEDLARVIGDAPAHALGQAGRRLADGLTQFVRARSGKPGA